MKQRNAATRAGIFVVILTLAILSCSGASDITNIFATETPTPTITYTPSPTFTPTATATATPIPSPTPMPTGVTVEQQGDGSTIFTDYDNRFRLVLPAGWVVIPFNKDDLTEVVSELGSENPQLAEAAESFNNMDPKLFRLVALNSNPDYVEGAFASNLNVTSIPDELMSSMPLAFVTGVLEQSFADSGFTVLTSGVNEIDNSHGVEVEYIDIEQSVNGVKTTQRVIVFQTDGSLGMVTITTLPQFSNELFATSDDVGASIELLK